MPGTRRADPQCILILEDASTGVTPQCAAITLVKMLYYFYEQQEEGLGSYFLDHLFRDIEALATFAGIHSRVYKKFFRSLSKKFPFAIYYTIENEIVFIRSIVDCRK